MLCIIIVNRFRWVACQLDELEKCTKRRKTLDSILGHLPDTLEATYDQILNRVPFADVSDAVKLLLWLAFAREPLHIDYLAVIVEFDLEKRVFNLDAKLSSPVDVLKICSSLVTKIGDNTVQLAHASVKQYVLEKKRTIQPNIIMDPANGDAFVGQCCLTYLLHSRESHPLDPYDRLAKPIWRRYEQSLIRYSAIYWSQHILEAKLDMDAIEQMKELFVLTKFSFKNWVEVYNYSITIMEDEMNSKCLLQCAALHGLTPMVEWLLPSVMGDGGVIYSVEDSEQVKNAASHGYQRNSSMLLEYEDALSAASASGHKEVVDLMLEKAADFNTEELYRKAIHSASEKGKKEILLALLDKGADVNAQEEDLTALQVASGFNHLEIVQLLLERGADINKQGKFGNALQNASTSNHLEIVQLLLERGADINKQGKCGNALQSAITHRNKEMVQLLLEKGADASVNARAKDRNSLQQAS